MSGRHWQDQAYDPGMVTALVLYVPFYRWVISSLLRARRRTPRAIIAAALPGSRPLLLQRYLVAFRGDRQC